MEDWEDELLLEKFEDQIFDTSRYRYASSSLVNDMYHSFGDKWYLQAVLEGFIPYRGEDGYVHWKLLRQKDGGK